MPSDTSPKVDTSFAAQANSKPLDAKQQARFAKHFSGITDTVICIMGPTACGKTDLACALYDNSNHYDIISVDSALVYKGMDIGTAKPTPNELAHYPHALVDIIDPTQSYSAADFVTDAKRLIKRSHVQGRTPILVGGTFLYFDALLGGMDELPQADQEVRGRLQTQVDTLGLAVMHQKLTSLDPKTAQRLKPTDSQRILRALEVYELTGKPLSALHTKQKLTPPAAWQLIAIEPERSWLHTRIEKRLNIMWQAGFVDEVANLLHRYDLSDDMPSMRAVGYRQVYQYLKYTRLSEDDRRTMQNTALYATRQLAKRQYTWLRKLKKHFFIQTFEHTQIAKRQLLI